MREINYLRNGGFTQSRRLLTLIASIACIAAILGACGGGNPRSVTTAPGVIMPVAVSSDVNPQVAEILAAPVPEGVDTALWDTLKNELARELEARKASQVTEEELPEWEWGSIWSYSYYDYNNGTRSVIWDTGFFRGDGSQNGIVDVPDLATIAQHFGQSMRLTEAAYVADYDGDFTVGIADISVLAKNFGKTCSSFKVEVSEVSRQAGFSTSKTLGYGESDGKTSHGFNSYMYEFAPGIATFAWARVIAYNAEGMAISCDTCLLDYGSGPGPYFPVNDLAVLDAQAGSVTWSSAFFEGDGDDDSEVTMNDIMPISMFWGQDTAVNHLATRADYDHNGIIDMLDLDSFLDHYGERCSGFLVELSTTSATSAFIADGDPSWNACANLPLSEFGFRVFEYTLQSRPAATPYWVRVTPYCDGAGPARSLGLPSAAVEFGGTA
jgi:hypothetical protein